MALGSWIGAWLAPAAAWATITGAVLTGVALVVALPLRRRTRRSTGGPGPSGPVRGLVLLAVLVGLGGGLVSGGVRADSRRAGPLHALAAQRADVSVWVTVTGDPHRRPGRVVGSAEQAPSIVLAGRVDALVVGRRVVAVRQPVVVIASGPGWDVLLPSQQVRLDGRLLPTSAGDLVAALLVTRAPPTGATPPDVEQRWAGSLRAGLRAAAAPLPPDERGLLPGLVVGDTSGQSAELTDAFRASGLTHVVAVSGSNCAIVLGAVLVLSRRSRLGLRGRAVLSGLGLLAFVVLARPSPSVLRAALMGALALVATATGRTRQVLPVLLGSVTVLLLLAPDLARSPGFALSVLATAGLVVLAPPLSRWLRDRLPAWCPGVVADVIAVPLAAQLACAPVIAAISGTTSLTAVPANLLALPAVPPATVLGVLALVLVQVHPLLGHLLAWAAEPACWWLVHVARAGAAAPGARLPWPSGAGGALLLVAVVLVVVGAARRRASRRALIALAVGVLLAQVLVVPVAVPSWPPHDWSLVACDVGQGDALLVRTAPAEAVLVDAGPDPTPLRACLAATGVRRLPAVVLTHLHADHVDGLAGALGRLPVGEVVVGPLREPPGQWTRVTRQVDAARVPLRTAAPGERWTVGGVRFLVLGPREVLHGTSSDPNNDSLVLLVEVAGLRLLLTGDVEPEAQQLLLADEPSVDVLKVPHHGSAHQEPAFLRGAHAAVGLVSVGAGNPYGHPSSVTLQDLRQDGTATWRTDTSGSVAVAREAGRLVVVPSRGH